MTVPWKGFVSELPANEMKNTDMKQLRKQCVGEKEREREGGERKGGRKKGGDREKWSGEKET